MSKRKFKVGDVVEFTEEYANFLVGDTFKVDEVVILRGEVMLKSYSPERISVWAFRVKLVPQFETKLGQLY